MQREALKDDEERRKRSEQMRKERAAVFFFPFVVHSIALVGFKVPYCILIEYFKNN